MPGCLALALPGACKPPAPTPTLYTDLGTDEQPLPPPAQAWNDASVAKGTAEWRPFRKPAEEKADQAKAATKSDPPSEESEGDSKEVEKEIRKIAAEFNAVLAENKLEDAANFLTDAQAEAANDVFAAVHALVEQLKAAQEAAPNLSEKIGTLAPLVNLSDALKVEIRSVEVVDETHATAKLAVGGEATFVVGDEDVWYFESPVMAVLIQQRQRIEEVANSIKDALAKGTPDEAAMAEIGKTLDELREALSANAQPEGNSG